jgi:site-specific recombinase XerD
MMTLPRHGLAIASGEQLCTGPLALHIEGFAAQLSRKGYAHNTVLSKRDVLADLSQWLERRHLSLEALEEGRLRGFLAARRRRGKARRGDRATGQQFLEYLRDRDQIAATPQRIDRTPAAGLTRDFEGFLYSERGLSTATVVSYLPVVRRFLDELFGREALRLDQMRPRELHGFVLREIQRVSRSHGKGVVTALRSFLRFLLQRGAIRTDLAGTLPGVATWRLSHLPKALPPEQVERLLASCDRTSPTGKRDHAILLLLARLGLRGGEVVAMTLEDLDWERGELVVRGKGQRLERLPLPADVGAALARYLCDVRPACDTRRVFIRMHAPHQGLARPVAICCVVRRALRRAGLDPELKGAHLLRHSLATDLLRRGSSLSEIGQLLRHRQPTTTQIYAKVDIAALRGIAQPWPRSAS